MLKKWVIQESADWAVGLPFLCCSCNDSVQTSTQYSPNQLLFGWDIVTPLHLLRSGWEDKEPSLGIPVQDFFRNLQKTLDTVRDIA